jgi:hypothetical protein
MCPCKIFIHLKDIRRSGFKTLNVVKSLRLNSFSKLDLREDRFVSWVNSREVGSVP